jgi:hypothetical protein
LVVLSYPEGGAMDPITYPLRAFAREQKVSPTYLYRLIEEGKLKAVLINKRRHIFPQSYRKLVEQLSADQGDIKLPSSNPKAKARAAVATPAAPARRRRRRSS